MSNYACKSIGQLTIDFQHQQLFNTIERFERHSKNEHSAAAAFDALAFVRRHLKTHFLYEEAVLSQYQYPKLAEHTALHKAITADVEVIWKAFKQGEDIDDLLIERMRWWIVDHINVEDAAFADFIMAAESASK
jgi:hemerythrin